MTAALQTRADAGPALSPPTPAPRRLDEVRSGAASGLGLAIVRRLVEADGGDVELRPAADGGLEAVVRFTHATRAVR